MSQATKSSRRGPVLAALVGVITGVVLSAQACNPTGTALYVTVELPQVEVGQLEFAATNGADLQFGPEVRPATEGDPLSSPQTLRVFLPEAYAGAELTVVARALRAGAVVGLGSGQVTVVRGKETSVTVPLSGEVPDAGGCFNCAGCCLNDACQPGTEAGACGNDGGSCLDCSLLRSDTCTNGGCGCGGGGPCEVGQSCKGGQCVCGPDSCAGCCDGNVCLKGNTSIACGNAGAECKSCGNANCTDAGTCDNCNITNCPLGCCSPDCKTPPSLDACGTKGVACSACDKVRADTCTDNGCKCGMGEVCPANKHCVSGNCVCDSVSCPKGCCDDNGVCQPGTELGACGKGGERCVGCIILLQSCGADQAC